MPRSGKLLVAALLAASVLAGDQSFAQHRESHSRWGSEDPSARADRLIRWFDSNQDGVIEPNEAHGQARYLYERTAKEAGLDPTHSISVGELRAALVRRLEAQAQSGSTTRGSGTPASGAGQTDPDRSHSPTTGGTAPAVPGFGTPADAAKVPGFGTAAGSGSSPVASASGSSGLRSGSSSSAATSGGTGPSQEMQDRVRRYAESLLRRYDENKNGVLEKSEWSQMRGSPEETDRNRDGVITQDELTARLMSYSDREHRHSDEPSSGSSSSSSSSGGSSSSRSSRYGHSRWSSSSSSEDESKDRKSYRFLTPTERLPEKLPDWFARKDANGDGQVSMAEFSTAWEEEKAAEFARYDLNNDGIVTPEECLAAENAAP